MKFLIFTLFLIYFVKGQTITYNIGNCSELITQSIHISGQNIFNFTNDIDCSGINFIPLGYFGEVPLKSKIFFHKY
jgi:hypothetical protein